MCCDMCTHYDECEAKNSLKENCCTRCSEYEYCKGEEKYSDYSDNDISSDIDKNEEIE